MLWHAPACLVSEAINALSPCLWSPLLSNSRVSQKPGFVWDLRSRLSSFRSSSSHLQNALLFRVTDRFHVGKSSRIPSVFISASQPFLLPCLSSWTHSPPFVSRTRSAGFLCLTVWIYASCWLVLLQLSESPRTKSLNNLFTDSSLPRDLIHFYVFEHLLARCFLCGPEGCTHN